MGDIPSGFGNVDALLRQDKNRDQSPTRLRREDKPIEALPHLRSTMRL